MKREMNWQTPRWMPVDGDCRPSRQFNGWSQGVSVAELNAALTDEWERPGVIARRLRRNASSVTCLLWTAAERGVIEAGFSAGNNVYRRRQKTSNSSPR